MADPASQFAVPDTWSALRVANSESAGSVHWTHSDAVEIEWPGTAPAPVPRAAPRRFNTVLRVIAATRFDTDGAFSTIDACVTEAVARCASVVLLPFRALGLADLSAAVTWGFHSRKLVLAVRRAAENAGVAFALTVEQGDRCGSPAIGDWSDLVDRFNSPAIGMVLDLRGGFPTVDHALDAIQSLGGRVRYVYADATMNVEHAEQILRALAAIRFCGLLVVPVAADIVWRQSAERLNASFNARVEAAHAD